MANSTKTRLDDLPADFVSFNQGPVAEKVAAAMMGISCGFVMLRLAARATRKARLGLDDWIILAALWTFISEITYGATITAVKLSILAMYDRLFPTKFMRRAVVSLAIVAMLWYLAVILVVFFQCDPIPRSWGGIAEGHCVDHYSYYTGLAANGVLFLTVPHIILDIIILSLPIREVRRLQIVKWQKAAVCGMFLLGGFITLVSVVRLKFVAELVNTEPGSDTTGNRGQYGDMELGRGGRGDNVRVLAYAAAADPHGLGLHCAENPTFGQQQQRGSRPERIPARGVGQPRQQGVDGGQLAAPEPRRLGRLVQVRVRPRRGAGPAEQGAPGVSELVPHGVEHHADGETGGGACGAA
ncbi:hypothetical protein PG996_001838 [Apiospora saccharicola]|uniref:Rhodopsin domain-containing protein n=1 Tax=Apiospora saccharicola TaxID=335842 RepID=A0ABR1WHT9_9PEZI